MNSDKDSSIENNMDSPSYDLKMIESNEELEELKSYLEINLPENYMSHGNIALRLLYGKLQKYPIKVFRATAKELTSFVFTYPIGTSGSHLSFSAVWDSSKIDNQSLGRLLSSIPDYNWNYPFYLCCGSAVNKDQFVQTWRDNLVIANTVPMSVVPSSIHPGTRLATTPEDIKIPKMIHNYIIKRLPASAAATMLSKWDYSFTETIEGLEERLSKYPAIGAFYMQKEEEELVAWVHQYTCGMIGMTYTSPDHRKKGLAEAVTLTLAKLISEEGRVPFVVAYDCRQ